MENEEHSVIIWCRLDPATNAIQLRMVSVATGEEVQLKSGGFLLRISIDMDTSVIRSHIRHIASGDEAYVQGGPNLRTFVKDCLLNSGKSEPAAPDAS